MKRYIVTSAQSNTLVHTATWANILAYAEHTDADILVSPFVYRQHRQAVRYAKKGEADESEYWWDKRVAPYLCDVRRNLAPGLDFCGELQISPTAVSPLSGLDSYTGRASSIIPHARFAVRSVATQKGHGAKLLYTTGTVTRPNYIQAKAGQKAQFSHGLGGLIVEVDEDGTWFVRQLDADASGQFYDLGNRVVGGVVSDRHSPAALVWGDIHVHWLEPWMKELGWGRGGILNTLHPRVQVFHDLLDFRSQNHHDLKKPWVTFRKIEAGTADVRRELDQAREFLKFATRPKVRTVVVASNHDEALDRWLQETDWRKDLSNAAVHLELNAKALQAGGSFNPAASGIGPVEGVTFLGRDDSVVVCKRYGGGVELALHGDLGAGGSRGSLKQFANTGRRVVVGHSHTAAWVDGCVQVGVAGNLDMGYNKGLSAWTHTNALVYPNGKRALFTVFDKRWKGGQ